MRKGFPVLVVGLALSGCPAFNFGMDMNSTCGGADAGPCDNPNGPGPQYPGGGAGASAAPAPMDTSTGPFNGMTGPAAPNMPPPESSTTFMPFDPSRVDGAAVDAFFAAVEQFNGELCKCLGGDLDSCTGTTFEQRQCEQMALQTSTSAATPWVQCATNYYQQQLACVQAAACGDTLASCDIVARSADAAGSLDILLAACGPAPQDFLGAADHCFADGPTGPVMCADGSMRDASVRCDGHPDCPTGEDELGCPADAVQIPCSDGSGSFTLAQHCDGIPQCADGSDDQFCAPEPVVCEFTPEQRCDGFADCADGSDELDCPPPPSFDCVDGNGSIPDASVCDGTPDCADGSDEATLLCG